MSLLSRVGWNVTASSFWGAGEEATKAVDENLSTSWSSAAGYPHDFIIDMGSAQSFDFLQVIPRPIVWAQPKDVEVYVSDDGLDWGSAVGSASWSPQSGSDIQHPRVVGFPAQNKRYVKLHMINCSDAATTAGFAEIYLGTAELSDRAWTVYATNNLSNYEPAKAIDGRADTFWSSSGGYPLAIWADMQKPLYIDTIKYSPRQDGFQDRFGAVEVYLSDDGIDWGSAVASDTWANDLSQKTITFSGATKRWFKLACSAVAAGGRDYGSCNELIAEGVAPYSPISVGIYPDIQIKVG